MNYIYDIILNFQQEVYDFFDWNTNDNIYHIRKIPIIKINNKQLQEIKNNIVKFDQTILNQINLKSETFKQNNTSKLKYTFIIATKNECLAIKLNKNGVKTKISTLLPNEQDDLLELIKIMKEIKLNYQIIKPQPTTPFKTTFEIENKNYIYNELNKIYKQNNFQKLNYLYLECFGKQTTNINDAYTKLKQEIKKTNSNFKKLYNIFQIINENNQNKRNKTSA